MDQNDVIVNRVSESALVVFDLEEYYLKGDRVVFDLKDFLSDGLILREKDFRASIKTHAWTKYHGKFVAITCSADAIIPIWAYMLVAVALQPYASYVIFGSLDQLEVELFKQQLAKVDWSKYKDAKVVLKGCSKVNVPIEIYTTATYNLKPYVSSLMFGEPCSTVPIYKAAKHS